MEYTVYATTEQSTYQFVRTRSLIVAVLFAYIIICDKYYHGCCRYISENSPTNTIIQTYAKINEPVHEKTNNLGIRPGPTETGLYRHRRWLVAGNCGSRK